MAKNSDDITVSFMKNIEKMINTRYNHFNSFKTIFHCDAKYLAFFYF